MVVKGYHNFFSINKLSNIKSYFTLVWKFIKLKCILVNYNNTNFGGPIKSSINVYNDP